MTTFSYSFAGVQASDMRILFLDDNKERHKAFQQRAIGCIVDYAWDADEAMTLLGSGKEYDLIMLDHDLGGPEAEGFLLDDGKDGRTVAGFIAEQHPKHEKATIVVHSLNDAGGMIMISVLRNKGFIAHRVPFAWRMFEKTENGITFKNDGTSPKSSEIDLMPD